MLCVLIPPLHPLLILIIITLVLANNIIFRFLLHVVLFPLLICSRDDYPDHSPRSILTSCSGPCSPQTRGSYCLSGQNFPGPGLLMGPISIRGLGGSARSTTRSNGAAERNYQRTT